MVVVDQIRGPLAGVAAEEPVEALEPTAQWPTVIRPRRRLELRGQKVPLADHVGVVRVLLEHLREEPVLERDLAVVARVARGDLVDRRGRVGVVVASGQHARARRRAQRRRVHPRIAQTLRGQRIDVRRRDRAPVASELPESRVIEHDGEHIRRTLLRPQNLRPRRSRLLRRACDHPRELGPRAVLRRRLVPVVCHVSAPRRVIAPPHGASEDPSPPWGVEHHPKRMTQRARAASRTGGRAVVALGAVPGQPRVVSESMATVIARISGVSSPGATSAPEAVRTRNHFLEIVASVSPSRSISYSWSTTLPCAFMSSPRSTSIAKRSRMPTSALRTVATVSLPRSMAILSRMLSLRSWIRATSRPEASSR